MNFITKISKANLILNCCYTDSLVYEIKTEDNYEDLYQDKNLFGFSDYPLDSKFFDPANKKVIGKTKMISKEKKLMSLLD